MVGIMTSKQQKFSQSDSVLISQLKKKTAVRSSPDPAKIGFSSDPVHSSPNPCTSVGGSREQQNRNMTRIESSYKKNMTLRPPVITTLFHNLTRVESRFDH